ncbi:MAG: GTP-binding protein [Anaerohalosphaera sp.]|nr:GTP-binding protein [Anaerohalosphaera sp.]
MITIDVYILTGYLGAGKTTTLNNLLRMEMLAESESALIINEFGGMNVDSAIVEPGRYSMFEINKGSVFCICTKTDLIKALAQIVQDGRAETLVIEATGIAEVGDIESLLNEPVLCGRFKVRGCLCVVDAVNFTKAAPFLKAVSSQVRAADGIIINKTDMATKEDITRLRTVLKGINDRAVIVSTVKGRIDQSFVKKLDHISFEESLAETKPDEITAVSFSNDSDVSREKFTEAVDSLGDRLVRFKGNVKFSDGMRFVEIVFGRITEASPIAKLSKGSAFTAIGWNISRDGLKQVFESLFN